MRRYFMLVVATTAAVLSAIGCGSDSDGGGDGGNTLTQCLGNNAEFTPEEFLAQTADGKGCSSASDVNTVCSNDMPLVAGTCGKGCLGMSDEATCVAGCIQDAVTHGNSKPLSNSCLTCYGADVDCARTQCLVPCGLGPTSAECATCRVEKGCAAAFYDCSGLPQPTGVPGAGGQGDF
ncbi:MAG TPA: hypothetical protein VER11_24570 [Polyangiaceae bacterium]|nr:hypothetical protein [Polyangiaceae bacterium]